MGLELDPEYVELEDLLSNDIKFESQYQISQASGILAPIHAFAYFRQNATKIICLMPSAQPYGAPQQNPVFHRWTWFRNFPDSHVISVSDPGLYASADLRAAWFMDRETDIVARLGEFVTRVSAKLAVRLDDVCVYGSSMGGFGALMLAAELRHAVAIAEVPQLDMRRYSIKRAVRDLEEKVVHSTLDDYYDNHPERVSVVDRFESTGVIPRFKLVTNHADAAFNEHVTFVSSLRKRVPNAVIRSDYELLIVGEDIGHRPLPTERGVSLVRSYLTTPPQSVGGVATTPIHKKSFRELVDAAVGVISQIKYVRSSSDTELYKEAKRLLHAAAAADVAADWPYRRLASLVKLWTGVYGEEVLQAAQEGLARSESLESFIYLCRALISKHAPEEAERSIEEAISEITNSDTRNVGKIFQALCRYELGDFQGYSRLIDDFRANKSESFEPYISIPVSTVITVAENQLERIPSSIDILGIGLDDFTLPLVDSGYMVVTSCDEKYFCLYGEYLVKSFTKYCSSEATLLISIITSDVVPLRTLMDSWSPINVQLHPVDLGAGVNEGPLASLVRFSTVYPVLTRLNRPIVVLDVDCAITAPLGRIVASHEGADICSRVLGHGASPWEKYTGGFAIFYPTAASTEVAGYIASAASLTASRDRQQWWIDQNCFEAGIRTVKLRGNNIRIDNVISERDDFCVMPEGSSETKKLILGEAMKAIEETASGVAAHS